MKCHDPEQDYQTALVLAALSDPEALRVLRLLAIQPQSPATAHAIDADLSRDEVARHLIDFQEAGMVEQLAKGGWYQLTELGRLAVRAVRVLG